MTARIEQPYLLVLFSLIFHVDDEGRRWIHPLWAKDLARDAGHADHIGQLQQCVEEGRTGVFFEAGNAADLKRTLERLAAHPELLATMAAACLDRAWKSTHACMHEARRRLIIDAFPGLAHPQAAGSTP